MTEKYGPEHSKKAVLLGMISAIILYREIARVPKTAGKCKILPREVICCIMNPNAIEWLGFFVLISKGNEG